MKKEKVPECLNCYCKKQFTKMEKTATGYRCAWCSSTPEEENPKPEQRERAGDRFLPMIYLDIGYMDESTARAFDCAPGEVCHHPEFTFVQKGDHREPYISKAESDHLVAEAVKKARSEGRFEAFNACHNLLRHERLDLPPNVFDHLIELLESYMKTELAEQ